MIDDIVYKHISKFSEKIVIFFLFVYYPSSGENYTWSLSYDFTPSLIDKELSLSSSIKLIVLQNINK